MKAANEWLKDMLAFLAAHKKKLMATGAFCIIALVLLAAGVSKERVGIIGIGLIGNSLIAFAFNWGLCPFLIKRFGLKKGFVLMVSASLLVNYATILFYDWTKQDWLGIELIKEVKEYQGESSTGAFTSWILKQSDPVVFTYLSIKHDPFVTTIYMREGSNRFNGMNGRDWFIFLLSTVIGDIYWALALFGGISLIKRVLAKRKNPCILKR